MSPNTEADDSCLPDWWLVDDLEEAMGLGGREIDLVAARAATNSLADSLEGFSTQRKFVALLGEIEDLLRTGDVAEASLRLDRWQHPKWSSPEECQDQYALAMEIRP